MAVVNKKLPRARLVIPYRTLKLSGKTVEAFSRDKGVEPVVVYNDTFLRAYLVSDRPFYTSWNGEEWIEEGRNLTIQQLRAGVDIVQGEG